MIGTAESAGAELVIPVLLAMATEEVAAPAARIPKIAEWDEPPDPTKDWSLGFYRNRTLRMLRRYIRMSVEAGRLPSLLGRELFETKVTDYRITRFEDCVIFVHDMRKSLDKLDCFSRSVIEAIVFQDYSQEEAARVLGCRRRTIARCYIEGLDRLSEILLQAGLLEPLTEPKAKAAKTSCQEGPKVKIPASYSKDGDNNLQTNGTFPCPACYNGVRK